MDLAAAAIALATLVIGFTLKKVPEPFVILPAGIIGMLLLKGAR